MPWTVNVAFAQRNGNAADVTATFTDPADPSFSFTWSSRVKTNNAGSVTAFVADARRELADRQNQRADETGKAAAIAATLNGA